jgi:ribosomal-protein-alanine N-acetyltransferase
LNAAALTTERLCLVPLPGEVLDAMLNGRFESAAELLGADPPQWWPEQRRYTFELRRDQLREHPDHLRWLLRAMVTRTRPVVIVGAIGFHEPPDGDGTVEIGYGVFSEYRRRGYAEEAVRAMIGWAALTPTVTRVRASVAPDNRPSLNLVAKLGFVQTGTQMDEIDGLELVFDRQVDPGERAASSAGRSPDVSL